ncbi:ABC-F family ATP-binding cassette domain-containing protein [Candidatus Zixiibacteriota bacterium]
MIALSLHKVAKSFPIGSLFADISWEIQLGQKIGFLGVNGIGKTSLLRIMSGDLEVDSGTVTRARGIRVGRLQQIPDRRLTETLFDYAAGGRADLITLKKNIDEVAAQLAESPAESRLAEMLGQYQHDYEALGGFELEHRAGLTLSGLGFAKAEYVKPLNTFSGGERTRAELARLLLADDEVILLDEPTNHLDLAAIEWLEEFIVKSPKAVVFVTHDRVFLNRVADSIVELSRAGLEFYRGGYEKYRTERGQRREKQRVLFERQRQEIKRIEDFIARNIAGQKTKQAQSRRTALAKLERLEKPTGDKDTMHLAFETRISSYREVLTVRDYTRSINQRLLLEQVSFLVERGDKIGVIGPNGSGKTTLLRGILGEDQKYTGKIELGRRVIPAYFDQHLASIVEQGTVIDQIWDEHPSFKAFELRSFLARFLFSGEDVFKDVAKLSGGEKSRLALAKLMLSRANFLLLDEPTNHLDIPSREVLEEALAEFEGTILVVSHDRYFLDRIVNKLLVVDNHTVGLHLGNYSAYLARRAQRESAVDLESRPVKKEADEWEQLRQKRRDRQKHERERQRLEDEIHRTEERLQEIDDLLVDETVQCDWQRLAELGDEKKLLTSRLEDLYPRWESFAGEE